VAILARIIQFVLWLLLATWLFRSVTRWLRGRASKRAVPPPAANPLFRDPVCGTHVAAKVSLPLEVEGRTYHFCSAECRARYLAMRPADRGHVGASA
jgi:YHS domain-containing protein